MRNFSLVTTAAFYEKHHRQQCYHFKLYRFTSSISLCANEWALLMRGVGNNLSVCPIFHITFSSFRCITHTYTIFTQAYHTSIQCQKYHTGCGWTIYFTKNYSVPRFHSYCRGEYFLHKIFLHINSFLDLVLPFSVLNSS